MKKSVILFLVLIIFPVLTGIILLILPDILAIHTLKWIVGAIIIIWIILIWFWFFRRVSNRLEQLQRDQTLHNIAQTSESTEQRILKDGSETVIQGLTPLAQIEQGKGDQQIAILNEESESINNENDINIFTDIIERFGYYVNQVNIINDKKKLVYHTNLNQIQTFSDAFNKIQNEIMSQGAMITINSTALEDFMESIELIAKNVSNAHEISSELVKTAESGRANIEKTIKLIAKIEGMEKKIASISVMIHDVAEKTHVLSINAAIESARAGTYGKGFSIVAQEIRKLAQDTSQASISIREMTNAISLAIKEEVDLIHENENHFVNITNGVDRTTQLISEIATSMKSKNKNIIKLKEWMTKMVSLTEKVEFQLESQGENLEGFEDMISNLIEINEQMNKYDFKSDDLLFDVSKNSSVRSYIDNTVRKLEQYTGFLVEIDNLINLINNKSKGINRKSERVPVKITCSISVLGDDASSDFATNDSDPSTQKELDVKMLDLSSTGALCYTKKSYSKNTMIIISFMLSGEKDDQSKRHYSGKIISTQSKIVSIEEINEGEWAGLYKAGINFENISLENRSYLAAFLYY
jgi:methyl-accepting chemotaxis protein